jgi:TDG/mug DNA glycosylase family protein
MSGPIEGVRGRGPALPLALARLHQRHAAGDRLTLQLTPPAGADHLVETIVGAGFALDGLRSRGRGSTAVVERLRTLPDFVGPGMRLLVVGLNPSLHAADAGVGFVTPGNRYWPAAIAAGVVTKDRDPWHSLRAHGVGMTDLVKRATPRADALTRDEYRTGVARLDRLCAWLQPGAVAVVGLAGWRAAVDRRAVTGWQARDLGGRPVYVLPSTSGLNAGTALDALTDHLRRAALDRSVK